MSRPSAERTHTARDCVVFTCLRWSEANTKRTQHQAMIDSVSALKRFVWWVIEALPCLWGTGRWVFRHTRRGVRTGVPVAWLRLDAGCVLSGERCCGAFTVTFGCCPACLILGRPDSPHPPEPRPALMHCFVVPQAGSRPVETGLCRRHTMWWQRRMQRAWLGNIT